MTTDKHETQIRRGRLPPREDVRAAFVDRELGRVDLLLALADLRTTRGIALDEHVERRRDLLLDEAAHREHLTAHVLDLAVELAGDVLGEVERVHETVKIRIQNGESRMVNRESQQLDRCQRSDDDLRFAIRHPICAHA